MTATQAETRPVVHTPDTLAALWCVSGSTIRNLIKRGELRAVRIGSQYRITSDAVEDYLCSNSQSGGSRGDTSSLGRARTESGRDSGYLLKHAQTQNGKP